MTPEGKVKALVKDALRENNIWFNMPVPAGYGEPMLDFICCVPYRDIGIFLAIETKAPGKKPTQRQEIMINKMQAAGAKVFVIDGPEGVAQLKQWLQQIKAFSDGQRS